MGLWEVLKGEEPTLFEKIPHLFDSVGEYGEYLGEYALTHGNLGEQAVFKNLLVPRMTGPTATSEIDLLMVHEKGIFVCESKNYSGWIFGNESQQNWTVSLKGGRKEHFYNPIKQNRAHVRALMAYLGITEPTVFRSYIVFSERCELKAVPEPTYEYEVLRRPYLLKHMRENLDIRNVVFSEAEMERIIAELDALKQESGEDARAQHVEEARLVQDGMICPYCGSQLVYRNGRNGQFIGCSAYPKCRYTRNI